MEAGLSQICSHIASGCGTHDSMYQANDYYFSLQTCLLIQHYKSGPIKFITKLSRHFHASHRYFILK